MGAKLSIFNDVVARLMAEVPTLKTVRKWNGQFNNEGRENAFAYPACFISFSSMVYKRASATPPNVNQAQSQQDGTYIVTLYLGFGKYQTETESWPVYEPIIQAVWAALQGWAAPSVLEYGPFMRIAEREDADHDNVIVWEIDFEVAATDCATLGDLVLAPDPLGLEVIPVVIIDPATVDDIRTAAVFP